MTFPRAAHLTVLIGLLALGGLSASIWYFPPEFTSQWWIVFGAFMALSLTSESLAVTVSEAGSTTTMDYVPHLGAILLLGPTGAGLLAAISCLIYQTLQSSKPIIRRAFNVVQITLSVVVAGVVFVLLGGSFSLRSFNVAAQLLPFIGSAIAYFVLNRLQVVYVRSISEDLTVREVLQELSVAPFAFDLAGSSLALLLAFLYIQWGLVALLVTLIPIIGLRYSYGVTLKLRQLNSDLLRVLIKTIEAQDPYTSGHSIRVAEGALALGRELGVSPTELDRLETAALLHDIGKIDSAYRTILTQQGPLSDTQAQLIKRHPQRGVDLVSSVRSIDPHVLKYIKHHHERFDGNGYPNGVQGENIPLGARIIMVSDAVDAMVTSRAYRDALSPEAARAELIDNKGTQFDPDVVDAAMDIDLVQLHSEMARSEASTVLRNVGTGGSE